MNSIKKIYPSHEELHSVTTCVVCTEQGCSSVFSSESNLNLHLVKTHKKDWDPDCSNKNKEYYCPDLTCIYNSTKSFKALKQLKQHYLKVHSDKVFLCQICNKGFATVASQNRHEKYCGVNFNCCECDTSYSCYESLLTHGRRKKHKVLEKSMYNPNPEFIEKSSSGPDLKSLKKDSFILPKGSTSLQLLNVIPFMVKSDTGFNFEKSSQTDSRRDMPQFKTKQTQVPKGSSYRIWTSKHSQTSDLLKMLSSTETQTIGDYVSKKRKLLVADRLNHRITKSEEDILQKSIKTQTNPFSETKSCNTTFVMDESEYDPFIQRSSSSTQTLITTLSTDLPYSTSTSTHDSIHTDTSDLNFLFMHSDSQSDLDDMSNFDSSSFLNCNMETQTDFMFDNDVLNEDCYSNIETQTTFAVELENAPLTAYSFNSNSCDDMPLNTTHTQTIYDCESCSVESQTLMSHNKLQGGLSLRDMANIETQTEIDLKLLLESINE